jgi:hypothetical protein
VERKARVAGLEFALDKTERGYQFRIESNPEHDAAREQVFELFDQLRAEARKAGVTSSEIMAHWMRRQVKRWGPTHR